MIIFHIDVNSAFLSWSAVKLLQEGADVDIREIPSIVGGDRDSRHGIVVAKSIPAKKFGIHTADTVASALQKCPNLVVVRPEHSYYVEMSRKLMAYLSSVCPDIEQVSVDECYMDFEPIKNQFESPLEAAHFIKDQVKERFGFTVNVGVSDRKVLAKMASDFKKPDLVHTLFVSEIQEKLWPLPVGELHMCGKSSAARLRNVGILTIGDLAKSPKEYIVQLLKKHGEMLWEYANGIDNRTVHMEEREAKGIGNSTTVAKDIKSAIEAKDVIKGLCQSVSNRLKKHGFFAGNICVEIKYNDFTSTSRQSNLPVQSQEMEELYETACKNFDQLWDKRPIRLLGVRCSKLEEELTPVQMNLFDYQKERMESEKQQKMNAAMDKIKEKFGDGSIHKGI